MSTTDAQAIAHLEDMAAAYEQFAQALRDAVATLKDAATAEPDPIAHWLTEPARTVVRQQLRKPDPDLPPTAIEGN